MVRKNLHLLVAVCLVGLLGGYRYFAIPKTTSSDTDQSVAIQSSPKPSLLPVSSTPQEEANALPNFAAVAKIVIPAVVQVAIKLAPKENQGDSNDLLDQLLREFFGKQFDFRKYHDRDTEWHPIGSGVICREDGYIITNNHVVEQADQIRVMLYDNRNYVAKLIGKDPSTDLAVLKIEEKGLPYLVVGNSDDVQVGEWVLAVGHPLGLTSTVTKGIVSAKARCVPDNTKGSGSMQSFIQTDAAVNPGSSGGALVNAQGELIGIPSALYSRGVAAFTGYALAIPSSIVRKVMSDFLEYGALQKVLLGVMIRGVNADFAKKQGLVKVRGVYIESVEKDGAGAIAGLQAGDVIIAVNGKEVTQIGELQEIIACCRPNDSIQVTIDRKGKEKTLPVLLKLIEEGVHVVYNKNKEEIIVEGATIKNVDLDMQKKLKITGGGYIKALTKGAWKAKGVKPGFIITTVDKEKIKDIQDLIRVLEGRKGAVLVEGLYANGVPGDYAVRLGE